MSETQKEVIASPAKQLVVVAGAGSGKTEVMSRRVAWQVAVEKVPKDSIVAFTFTEKAAEEIKFRIRSRLQELCAPGEEATLGGMYVGTIHGYCLNLLKNYWPDPFHTFEILDETSRFALVDKAFLGILGLNEFQMHSNASERHQAIGRFLRSYDLLNEYDLSEFKLAKGTPPTSSLFKDEKAWCEGAKLLTDVGKGRLQKAFSRSCAAYYAYTLCRRFIDFSTTQTEVTRRFSADRSKLAQLQGRIRHVIVDEVQDINPVQKRIIDLMVGDRGRLTAVGDHRQAIYAFRGGRVDIMGEMARKVAKRRDGRVVDMMANYRSTPRIVAVANAWARTIGSIPGMPAPDMVHGNLGRDDYSSQHIAVRHFRRKRDARVMEANWIATSIRTLVDAKKSVGAKHDTGSAERGIGYGDIVILLRYSTDARKYMRALEDAGIPVVVRSGPDLFSQPEIQLAIGALGIIANKWRFWADPRQPKTLGTRIANTLGVAPGTDITPDRTIKLAAGMLRSSGVKQHPS